MLEDAKSIVAGHQQTAMVDVVHQAQEQRIIEARETLQLLDKVLGTEKGKGQIGNFGVRILSPKEQVDAIVLQSPIPAPRPKSGAPKKLEYWGLAVMTSDGPMMTEHPHNLTEEEAGHLYSEFLTSSHDWRRVKVSETESGLAKKGRDEMYLLKPFISSCSFANIVNMSMYKAEELLQGKINRDRASANNSVAARQPVESRVGAK